ncbi:MAG: metallophosphoesterase [Candidatus Eremiobacteraeota bacterium]|nr:metallophosphoesterase [Candidatus Eremiobacteraeota bacterium]
MAERTIDRAAFLECMAWCGTGVVYGLTGAGLVGKPFNAIDVAAAASVPGAGATFVQISDTHIGFHGEANGDVIATFKTAIDKINALPQRPDFVMHTGDLSHLSKPEEFDTVKQLLGTIKTGAFFSVAGEHDVINDRGKMYFSMFESGSATPWYSFDMAGVHALALTNVIDIKAGGILGRDQLDWCKRDLALQKPSTPIVVFAHIPLAAVYPDWGWTTDDYAELLTYLQPFESVTVLNGHIHQVFQKNDGKVQFYTAMSTAFPQPKPGSRPKPGPLTVPAGELSSYLGIRDVTVHLDPGQIAVADATLG